MAVELMYRAWHKLRNCCILLNRASLFKFQQYHTSKNMLKINNLNLENSEVGSFIFIDQISKFIPWGWGTITYLRKLRRVCRLNFVWQYWQRLVLAWMRMIELNWSHHWLASEAWARLKLRYEPWGLLSCLGDRFGTFLTVSIYIWAC